MRGAKALCRKAYNSAVLYPYVKPVANLCGKRFGDTGIKNMTAFYIKIYTVVEYLLYGGIFYRRGRGGYLL